MRLLDFAQTRTAGSKRSFWSRADLSFFLSQRTRQITGGELRPFEPVTDLLRLQYQLPGALLDFS